VDLAQARSLYELMMLTAWADGRLEASETLVADALRSELPELHKVRDHAALADSAKARLQKLGLKRALTEVAAPLRDPADRELAFVCCARVLEADGIIAKEEFQVLAALKALFGFGSEDVARLLRSAAE